MKNDLNKVNIRNKKYYLKEDFSIWRSVFMMFFMFLLFGALIGRTIYVQFINSDFLQERGNERFMRNVVIPSFRGKIFDNQGNILAITNMTKNAVLNPKEAKLSKDDVKKLANLLNIKEKFIEEKMKIDKEFIYLKKNISLDLYKELVELKLKGVFFETSQKRFYPYSENVSHVVGFIDAEGVGQEGIELEKNEHLSGVDGRKTIIKNRLGETVNEIGEEVPPVDGKNVQLTINAEIQSISRKYLLESIKKFNAKAGSVVVLNAKTGEILSLVNYPDYDPNSRDSINNNTLRNRAIIDIYEPGSTMKPFPVALAIEKNLIKENTLFITATVKIGKKTISDTHVYPTLTTSGIIQKSSNIGTVKIAMNFKPEEMWKMFDDVNFGRKVGIGFPGESRGILRGHEKWKPIEQANMAFGHGMSVNLLQMVNAYQVFTHDGMICDVHLIKSQEQKERQCRQVFSARAANKVKEMLRLVTEKGGTATLAQTADYHVAGKTGTANKVENGRYVSKYIGSFIGFAPAQNPEIIVGVTIDEPRKGSYYGGIVAAPVFSGIVADTLKLMKVPIEKFPEGYVPPEKGALENVVDSSLNNDQENIPILSDEEEDPIQSIIEKHTANTEPVAAPKPVVVKPTNGIENRAPYFKGAPPKPTPPSNASKPKEVPKTIEDLLREIDKKEKN